MTKACIWFYEDGQAIQLGILSWSKSPEDLKHPVPFPSQCDTSPYGEALRRLRGGYTSYQE